MLKKLSIMLLAVYTASCGSSPTSNNILKIAVPIEPVSLTPYASNDTASYRVRWQIFERLIDTDKNGVMNPMLATSWTNISPTTIQLTLRSNVLFHNGKEFTAEDAKHSIESAVASSDLFAIIGVIKDVDVVDDYTINVNYHTTYGPKDLILGHPGILMTSKSTLEEDPESLIGTGAFKYKQWDRGQKVTLSKFDDYWGGASTFEEVEFLVVPEASVRSIVVETGEVDIAYDIDGSDVERIRQNSELNYLQDTSPTVHYLGFTLTKPQYQDKRFRQALSLAIDYQGIVEQVVFGIGEVAPTLLQKEVFGAHQSLPVRKRDLVAAKALLEGVELPETINIYTIDGIRKKMAEIIQANLLELGMNAQVQTLEWPTMLDFAKKGNLDLFMLGWTTVPPDADIGLTSLILSENKFVSGNYSAYSNTEIDRLLKAGRSELNTAKRIQIYNQVLEMLYEDVPLIPLFHPYHNAVTKKDIQGFKINYFSTHDIKSVVRK